MHTKAQNTMPIFIDNQFYHVYNRANGDDKLFYTDANYLYFLSKLNSYISAFVEIYAYCLIPNHFHLLVKVKDIPTPVRFTKLISPEEKESNKPDRWNRFEFRSGLNFLLLVLLIPFNFHFMRSYDINVGDQDVLVHILHQMQTIEGNVFQLYKADMMDSFPYIDNVKPAAGGLTMRIEPTAISPKQVSSKSSRLIRRCCYVYRKYSAFVRRVL